MEGLDDDRRPTRMDPRGERRQSAAGRLLRGLDLLRRLLVNAVFLVLVVALIAWLLADRTPTVPKSAALVVAPNGFLVEQLSGDPMSRAIDRLTGSLAAETRVRDLEDAIRGARDDERIRALYLDLDRFGGGGLTKLQAVAAAVADFKTSGKPVIAGADGYSQSGYYLAATADEVYLHDMGAILLSGYGRFRTYYKEGIDRLELDWNVFRVGEYKSAVEPYLRDGMSEEARVANLAWLGDLWGQYLEDVAPRRSLTPADLGAVARGFPERLREERGHAARAAQAAGLVDHIGPRDQVEGRLIELVGEDDGHRFHRIGTGAYLAALGDDRPSRRRGDDGDVAVIVAAGPILDGSHPPGVVGGDSTAALVRSARHDEDVAAIVLRVDSGGGSAFASEVIRRELELAREDGKTVVVSMGSVAASGGYWIATASDEIWAQPSTITGSIGIFGMFPTYQKPLARYLGMRVDGVGTLPLSGAFRPDRELDPALAEAIQLIVEQGYEDFLSRVAEARDMSRAQVDAIARGRVWSGAKAHELDLVDRLGNLEDAIASSAALAGLGDDYGVRYLARGIGWRDRLVIGLIGWAGDRFGSPSLSPRRPTLIDAGRAFFAEQEALLATFNDPQGVYAACLCDVR